MRKITQIFFLFYFTIFLMIPSSSNAVNRTAGTTAGRLLTVIPSPRPVALGNAYTAVQGEIHSIFFNPAGLAYARKNETLYSHKEGFLDIRSDLVAGLVPIGKLHTIAAGIFHRSFGDIQRTDVNGLASGGSLRPSDMVVTMAYARQLSKRYSAGGSLKILHQNLDAASSTNVAFDIGVSFRFPDQKGFLKRYQGGISVQNIGPSVTFIQESFDLPTLIRLGNEYKFEQWPARILVDVSKTRGEDWTVHLGGEAEFWDLLNLRVGYQSFQDLKSGFNLGFGVHYKGLTFDYAWTPIGEEFTDENRISISYAFGRDRKPASKGFTQNAQKKKRIAKKSDEMPKENFQKPTSSYGWMQEGMKRYQEKNYQGAWEAYKEATLLNPDNADIHFNLGITDYLLGRRQEAIDEFKQTLSLNPNHLNARKNLNILQRRK